MLIHKWFLDIKQRKTSLQATTSENLDNKEDPKERHTWIYLGRRKRQDLLSNLGAMGKGKVEGEKAGRKGSGEDV